MPNDLPPDHIAATMQKLVDKTHELHLLMKPLVEARYRIKDIRADITHLTNAIISQLEDLCQSGN